MLKIMSVWTAVLLGGTCPQVPAESSIQITTSDTKQTFPYDLENKKLDKESTELSLSEHQKATCASFTSCGSCIPVNYCGWCSSTNTCTTGTAYAPTTCPSTSWFYFNCPASTCSTETSCGACTLLSTCGWCSSSNTCISGRSMGPLSGTCDGDWKWYTGSCTNSATCELGCAPEDAGYTSCRGGTAVTKTGKWCNINGQDYCCSNCCKFTDGLIATFVVVPVVVVTVFIICCCITRRNRMRNEQSRVVPILPIPSPIEGIPHVVATAVPCGEENAGL